MDKLFYGFGLVVGVALVAVFVSSISASAALPACQIKTAVENIPIFEQKVEFSGSGFKGNFPIVFQPKFEEFVKLKKATLHLAGDNSTDTVASIGAWSDVFITHSRRSDVREVPVSVIAPGFNSLEISDLNGSSASITYAALQVEYTYCAG